MLRLAALESFLESMVLKKGAGNKLADASTDAVMALSRSLKENQAASDDRWQEAIEATLITRTKQTDCSCLNGMSVLAPR